MATQMSDTEQLLQYVKGTAILFLATGIGMGIAGWALLDAVTSASGDGMGAALIGGLIGLSALVVVSMAGPVVGAVSGVRGELQLARTMGVKRYGVTGITVLVGHIAMVVLAFFITLAGFNSSSGSGGESGGTGGTTGGSDLGVGEYLMPIIIGGIGAAITAVAAQYAYAALSE